MRDPEKLRLFYEFNAVNKLVQDFKRHHMTLQSESEADRILFFDNFYTMFPLEDRLSKTQDNYTMTMSRVKADLDFSCVNLVVM